MKPFVVNLIYGILLIGLSLWGYFTSASPSATAFIPIALGAILLALTPAMKKQNKMVAHIVVVLTLVIIIAMVKPLTGAMGRSDNSAIARVAAMIVWGIVAMVVYIKSFVDARKNKA